jgi:putative copper export protein
METADVKRGIVSFTKHVTHQIAAVWWVGNMFQLSSMAVVVAHCAAYPYPKAQLSYLLNGYYICNKQGDSLSVNV